MIAFELRPPQGESLEVAENLALLSRKCHTVVICTDDDINGRTDSDQFPDAFDIKVSQSLIVMVSQHCCQIIVNCFPERLWWLL